MKVGVKHVDRPLGPGIPRPGSGSISSSPVTLDMPLPLSQAQFPPQSLKMESTVDSSLDKPGRSKLLPRPCPVLGPWTQRWSWCSALRWGERGGSLGWAALPVLEQLRALVGRHVHGSPRLGNLPG